METYYKCIKRSGAWECRQFFCSQTHQDLGVLYFNVKTNRYFTAFEMKAIASRKAVDESLKILAFGVFAFMVGKAFFKPT